MIAIDLVDILTRHFRKPAHSPSHDDLDKDQLPAEYEQIMNLDIMEPFDWIGLMPMPGSIDAILKRAQALKLLSDSADRVIGTLAG